MQEAWSFFVGGQRKSYVNDCIRRLLNWANAREKLWEKDRRMSLKPVPSPLRSVLLFKGGTRTTQRQGSSLIRVNYQSINPSWDDSTTKFKSKKRRKASRASISFSRICSSRSKTGEETRPTKRLLSIIPQALDTLLIKVKSMLFNLIRPHYCATSSLHRCQAGRGWHEADRALPWRDSWG